MSIRGAKNPRTIRRALLAVSTPNGLLRRNLAGIIGLGVVVAFTGTAAEADNGNPVILGTRNDATDSTTIYAANGDGLYAETNDVSGYAGVGGTNLGGGDGVLGYSRYGNGMRGVSYSPTASGVYGENNEGGYGVAGRSTKGGVAVLADTADGTGTALRTTGKLEFQKRSGTVRVASGHTSITVTLAGVTTTSMVTATVQQTGGFFVQAAVPHAGSFTIYINKAPVSPATVKVAYLVLN